MEGLTIVKSNDAGRCPVCNGETLSYESKECDGEFVYYRWRCDECGAEGKEYYRLEFAGHNLIVDEEEIVLDR